MFEAGDIVINSEDLKGIVLKCDNDMVHLLLYDFSTVWVNEDDCIKIGSTYAIYRSMFELNGCNRIR